MLTLPKRSLIYFYSLIIGLLLLTNIAWADVVISGNTNINTATTYNNVVLDMSAGRFTINPSGTLTVKNSTINITVSPGNPFFALLNNGGLVLDNNTVNVTVSGISSTPTAHSLYPLINIQQGSVLVKNSNFTVDAPFTVSLLETHTLPTNGITITNNKIKFFHGGIYLNNSNAAEVNGNTFSNVSFSNIYNQGNLSSFKNNIILFPGNLSFGNAFDIINSDSITITNNIISSGANYGIFIMGGQNIFIDSNKIADNLSYGIFIETPALKNVKNSKYLSTLLPLQDKTTFLSNTNISIINNYIAQNRYGIAGGNIGQLIVTNNTFLQRFTDSSIREYWTNNDILLASVSNLTWINNFYKEAFTQDVPGDNSMSLAFVPYPAHGGVIIP